MGKHIVTLQMEELGQKHNGRDQFCHVGGRRGNKGLALGWELEERRMCWVKKKVGERHSRQRQQPEQRLRGSAEQGLCMIKEGRKVIAARLQRNWDIRGLQLQKECGLTLRVFV